MKYADLREFVAKLEMLGDLKHISVPVSPHLEMTEICDRTLHAGGPALLFDKPKGQNIPVLANLFGTPRRVALGMGVDDVSELRRIGQLLAMLKAAMSHKGTVVLDVISPCVTFNDHEGSTKSYKYMQAHEEAIGEVGFVPHFEDISVDYDPGTTYDVEMHDGSHLRLRKLHESYNPVDRIAAVTALMEANQKGEVLTGLFYIDTKKPDFTTLLNMVPEPLATLPQERIRPAQKVLDEVMETLR